jgi:histone H3/H4
LETSLCAFSALLWKLFKSLVRRSLLDISKVCIYNQYLHYLYILISLDCNMNAIHAKRVTIQVKDSQLARRYYQKFSVHGF